MMWIIRRRSEFVMGFGVGARIKSYTPVYIGIHGGWTPYMNRAMIFDTTQAARDYIKSNSQTPPLILTEVDVVVIS